jgi:hypothetical protein
MDARERALLRGMLLVIATGERGLAGAPSDGLNRIVDDRRDSGLRGAQQDGR